MKYVFQGIGVVILSSAAWHFLGGADCLHAWLHPTAKTVAKVEFQNDGPSAGLPASAVGSAPKNIPMAVSGARKCRQGGRVFYTDRECPSGAQEQDIQGGSINVVKGTHVNKSNSPVANPLPTARDLLGSPDGTLADKRM